MADPGLLVPPRRAGVRVVVAAGTGTLVGAVGWVLGLDVEHAVATGLAVAAVLTALGSLGRTPDPAWPADPELEVGRGWHGVSLTSRLLEQLDAEPDRIPRLLLPRLRAVLVRPLADRGAAPGSAAARELVGPDLHDLLGVGVWPATAPSATELTDRVLAVVARLTVREDA